MSRRFAALAWMAVQGFLVSACATPPRPKELAELEALRASPTLSDDDRRAFDLLAAADDLAVRARGDWQRNDLASARRDALVGRVKMSTAIAILQSQHERARIAELDRTLAVASDEAARLDDELDTVKEEVRLLQRLRDTKATAAKERRELAVQMDTVNKQAATERQKLAQQLTAQARRADAVEGIHRAELAIRTAETVDSPRYAKAKYSAAAGMLQQAHKELDAGQWDDAVARTALAASEADAASAIARPLYEHEAAIMRTRFRDRALEADATAIVGVRTRLERAGDLQRLVIVLGDLFADDNAVLLPSGAKILDSINELLAKYQTYSVEVSGISDESGKPGDPPALSLARANAVFWALASRGTDVRRMTVDGKRCADEPVDASTLGQRPKRAWIELSILYHVSE